MHLYFQFLEQAPWWLAMMFIACFGACLGSFLNVLMYRLPRGESVVWPDSRCTHCQHAIRFRHNLPVVGWLMLRGKCYDCDAPISPRYPLIEAGTALLFVLLGLLIGML